MVRTATDALGSIHQGAPTFIPHISRLLIEDRTDWHEEERRGWTIQDQVRTNAAMAFTRLGKDAVGAEEVLFHVLDDPCGHVGAFAMDALRRIPLDKRLWRIWKPNAGMNLSRRIGSFERKVVAEKKNAPTQLLTV